MEKVNVYDWDKTIFPVDSTVAFVRWCLRRHPGVIRALLGTLALLPGYWLGKVSKTAIKERMYGFLRRVPDVDAELEAFWAQNFARVNPWYLAQRRPDDIIISASPEFLVRIPAQKLGVRLLNRSLSAAIWDAAALSAGRPAESGLWHPAGPETGGAQHATPPVMQGRRGAGPEG